MANGYKLDKGFLFDHSWEKQFRKLKPKDFYTLFWELYDFQQSAGGSRVDEHDDNVLMSSIVTFVVPQIENRINGAKRSQNKQGTEVPPTPRGTLPPTSPPTPTPTPLKLSQDKLSQDKLRESNAPAHAREGKKAYGEFSNVFLTEAEHTALTERFGGNTEKLLNTFSCKLKAKGYTYDNHYATLLLWAEEDGVSKGNVKSYDTDDFFEASLKRSYEEFDKKYGGTGS